MAFEEQSIDALFDYGEKDMRGIELIAVSHRVLNWGVHLLIAGAACSALGIFGWLLNRKSSPEERSNSRNSLYGQRAYMALFLGPALVGIAVILLIVGLV